MSDASDLAARRAVANSVPGKGVSSGGVSERDHPSPSPTLLADPSWRAVAAAFAFNGFLFGAWASRVPAFKDRFALDEATLGVLLLALAGGAIVSFPLAGVLSERMGPSRLTIGIAWSYGPALVLLALAPNAPLLGAALFAFGAAHGAMDVAMNGWAARVEEGLGRPTMSVFHALFSLGAGLGAASGFAAVAFALEPVTHFLAVTVPLAMLALAVMTPAPRIASDTSDDDAPLLALPTGTLALVGLIALGVSMGEGAMADWSAVFLREAAEASDAEAALGYAAFSAAMVATRLSGDVLTRRFGAVRTARASGLVAFAGLAIVVAAPSLASALAGFALVGVGYAVIMPLVFSRAARDRTMRPGPALAAVATLGYGGMLLGPPLVGFLAHATSLSVSFGALGLLALLSAGLAGYLKSERGL